MLAARSASLLTASPLGIALGGPVTAALGPRLTLAGLGLTTVVLGPFACVLLLAGRSSGATGPIRNREAPAIKPSLEWTETRDTGRSDPQTRR